MESADQVCLGFGNDVGGTSPYAFPSPFGDLSLQTGNSYRLCVFAVSSTT